VARLRLRGGCLLLLAWSASAGVAVAQPVQGGGQQPATGKSSGKVPAVYRSKNFLIRTDLAAEPARKLLKQLETVLGSMVRYWKRPNRRVIECYIVKDFRRWPKPVVQKMDRQGVARIRAGTGVTRGLIVRRRGRRFRAAAKVYSPSGGGIPLHEAVHAYCTQAFGHVGPAWFAEGLAEMGRYYRDEDGKPKPGVHCPPFTARLLRRMKPKPVAEIIAAKQVTGNGWKAYTRRWALCHLLAHNPNYSDRFRTLGIALMTRNRRVNFRRLYGSRMQELEFEYRFFVKHVEPGFRVGLCAWDWTAKHERLPADNSVTATIDARGGWQPAGLRVKEGETYRFDASGKWKLKQSGNDLTAEGNGRGEGRLVGVLFHDYQLSEPFELGASGRWTASSDGVLLLRCRDNWGRLADNAGRIKFRLERTGSGNATARMTDD